MSAAYFTEILEDIFEDLLVFSEVEFGECGQKHCCYGCSEECYEDYEV